MKKLFIPVFILSLFALSCKKEGNNNTCTTSVASISGSYKINSLVYKASATSADVDYLATFDPCQKDDIIRFNTNGTADYQDVGAICSPNGSNTITWSLNGNSITIDGETGTIQSFDCQNWL